MSKRTFQPDEPEVAMDQLPESDPSVEAEKETAAPEPVEAKPIVAMPIHAKLVEPMPVEGVPLPEALDGFAHEWAKNLLGREGTALAERLVAELNLVGIHTIDQLAGAGVTGVRRALMAALYLDAQALTAAAARYRASKES